VISKKNPYCRAIWMYMQYGCRCNMDSFLLNKKGIDEISIAWKFLQYAYCASQYAYCDMVNQRQHHHEALISLENTQMHRYA